MEYQGYVDSRHIISRLEDAINALKHAYRNDMLLELGVKEDKGGQLRDVKRKNDRWIASIEKEIDGLLDALDTDEAVWLTRVSDLPRVHAEGPSIS